MSLASLSIEDLLIRYPSLKSVRKWHISLFCGCNEHIEACELEDDNCWSTLLVRDVTALRGIRNMERLSLDTALWPEDGSVGGTDEQCFKTLCNPFRTLRSTNCVVSIPGQPDLEKKISADILSTKPIVELDSMRRRLVNLFNDIIEKSDHLYWTGRELDVDYHRHNLNHYPLPYFEDLNSACHKLEEIDRIR